MAGAGWHYTLCSCCGAAAAATTPAAAPGAPPPAAPAGRLPAVSTTRPRRAQHHDIMMSQECRWVDWSPCMVYYVYYVY
jgi:hypothetical protein